MVPLLTMNKISTHIIPPHLRPDSRHGHIQHQFDTMPPSSSPDTPFFTSIYHSPPTPSTTTTTITPTMDGDGPVLSVTPVLSSSASTTSNTSSYSSTVPSHDEEDLVLPHEHFYSHLQTHSSLLRIVLRRPLPVTMVANQWHRLKLEVRDEFGMTLEGQRAKASTMHLACELLEQTTGAKHAVHLSTEWNVSWRPLHYDAWESMDDVSQTMKACSGFDRSATRLYLRVVPTFGPHQTIHALPLVIGPFSVDPTANWKETTMAINHTLGTEQQSGGNTNSFSSSSSSSASSPSPQLCNFNCYSQNMYRAFNLCGMNRYFMIREGWDLGTPGKMWDSALMISDLFIQKIIQQPACLENCHLLDLSAGTGATGLLISFIYKHLFPEYHQTMKTTLTDLPEALPLIHYNQQLNGIATTNDITVAPLCWGEMEDMWHIKKKAPIDIIIASDVLYEPSQFAALMKTLVYLSEPGHTVIYLGYKRRGLKASDEEYFFTLCSGNGDDNDMGYGDDNDTFGGKDGLDDASGTADERHSKKSDGDKVGWEKRYGKLMRNVARIDGEGWLGSYAEKWRMDYPDSSSSSNSKSDSKNNKRLNNKRNSSSKISNIEDQAFQETGVQIFRLIRKQQGQ
ncbi:putative methyltransferase-domain-containing protein [Absidia repens]|uniref:Putative methyltransferase-domain-containing protein n=1 Tax=Absidia repens TaxID=90262 RepID=A0A1X2IN55_9FUNG|nr:putative methyltransferase-domain-containing protein [Absidia repens]